MQEKDWVREKTRLQLNQIESNGDVTAQANVTNRLSKFFTLIYKLSRLAMFIAFLSLIIFIALSSQFSITDTEELRADINLLTEQVQTLTTSITDTEGLREDINLLTEQVQILTTSISDLKINKLEEQVTTMRDSELGNNSVVMPEGRELVTEVQTMLANKNYDPGPTDGIWGNKAASALRSYQSDNNIPPTGRIDEVTYTSLKGNK